MISYNVHCSLRWFFTLNNVTAYLCYWTQQVNLQEEGVTADVVSCNKVFSWWVYIVAVTGRASGTRKEARARRGGGGGGRKALPLSTLARSHAAGFTGYWKWNCLLAGRWSCSQRKHFATSPWNGMSENVGCFLKLIMYSPINLRSAIAGFILF